MVFREEAEGYLSERSVGTTAGELLPVLAKQMGSCRGQSIILAISWAADLYGNRENPDRAPFAQGDWHALAQLGTTSQ